MLVYDILRLVASFDDEQGLPEATYDATCGIITYVVGLRAANVFRDYMDATDGRFYLKTGVDKGSMLKKMVETLS